MSLNVTVTDGQSRYVTDLDQEDFLVFEDGVKQEVTFFTRSQLPIALVDCSSTRARAWRTSWRRRRRRPWASPADCVRRTSRQVIDFDSRVNILQAFTNDGAALEKAIRSTAAGGSTSLYNAIYIALKELKKSRRRSRPTRSAGRRSSCSPTARTRRA